MGGPAQIAIYVRAGHAQIKKSAVLVQLCHAGLYIRKETN